MKKIKQKKPLPRHQILAKRMLENGGKGKPVSLSKAMKESGYSDAYSKNPQKLKGTRSWEVLMKDVLNDEMLAQKHRELLNAKQVERFIFATRMKDDEITEIVEAAGFKVIVIRPSPMGKMAFYSKDDAHAVKFGLDMAFKLKGKYAPEVLNLRFKGYSKEQLIDHLMSKLAKKK